MSLFENLSYQTLIKAAVAEGNFGPRRTYDPTDPQTDSPKACVVPVRALLAPPPWLLMNPMRLWQIPVLDQPKKIHSLVITESVFYKPLPRKIALLTVFFQLSNKKL